MTFKEIQKDDLAKVFFNIEEFGIEIQHENEEDFVLELLPVIFDEKTEVILDASSEYADSVAFEPSFLIESSKAESINSRSLFRIENVDYAFSSKEKEHFDLLRVFLEKR